MQHKCIRTQSPWPTRPALALPAATLALVFITASAARAGTVDVNLGGVQSGTQLTCPFPGLWFSGTSTTSGASGGRPASAQEPPSLNLLLGAVTLLVGLGPRRRSQPCLA